jgi:hypothetical protein
MVPIATKKADQIISVSESTTNDAVQMMGIDPFKIKTIPLGSYIHHSDMVIKKKAFMTYRKSLMY